MFDINQLKSKVEYDHLYYAFSRSYGIYALLGPPHPFVSPVKLRTGVHLCNIYVFTSMIAPTNHLCQSQNNIPMTNFNGQPGVA